MFGMPIDSNVSSFNGAYPYQEKASLHSFKNRPPSHKSSFKEERSFNKEDMDVPPARSLRDSVGSTEKTLANKRVQELIIVEETREPASLKPDSSSGMLRKYETKGTLRPNIPTPSGLKKPISK
jgi:hypothetical protein